MRGKQTKRQKGRTDRERGGEETNKEKLLIKGRRSYTDKKADIRETK